MDKTSENNKKASSEVRNRLLGLAYTALFAAVIAVCSQIQLPVGAVPFTLQTLGVFIAAGMLGAKRGTLCVLVYILLGAVGLPVFSGFSGGVGHIAGPTGGYIIGFLLTALIVGIFADLFGRKIWALALGMVAGLIACYAFGTVWFMIVSGQNGSPMDIMTVLGYCVFPFILPDAAKLAVAVILVNRLSSVVPGMPRVQGKSRGSSDNA